MSISNEQLETWSHQGSITQSSDTYSAIKNTLKADSNPYVDKDYEVFLQGSYGNETNIYAESDVDVVIKLNDCFLHNISALPKEQQDTFHAVYSKATYTLSDFKIDVFNVLKAKYGQDAKIGDKAIKIEANGNRRKSDVIVALEFRKYSKFPTTDNAPYVSGIVFFNKAGERIVNYPKLHLDNCTKKHQNTQKWFKPMVRIFKNLRNKMIDEKMIPDDLAPSYYLEGLLYNVLNDQYTRSTNYETCFFNCINWLHTADRSKFVCANVQFYLLHEDSPVTWRAEKCDQFIKAAIKF
jgi:hypothetical protein